MKNSEKPAHPLNENDLTELSGLTKREYFAVMAMQGMIATGWSDPNSFEEVAKRSVAAATLLLIELEKPQS